MSYCLFEIWKRLGVNLLRSAFELQIEKKVKNAVESKSAVLDLANIGITKINLTKILLTLDEFIQSITKCVDRKL